MFQHRKTQIQFYLFNGHRYKSDLNKTVFILQVPWTTTCRRWLAELPWSRATFRHRRRRTTWIWSFGTRTNTHQFTGTYLFISANVFGGWGPRCIKRLLPLFSINFFSFFRAPKKVVRPYLFITWKESRLTILNMYLLTNFFQFLFNSKTNMNIVNCSFSSPLNLWLKKDI